MLNLDTAYMMQVIEVNRYYAKCRPLLYEQTVWIA